MTDHTKLLARLRTAPPNVLKDREAADAITALQAENAQWRVDFKEMVIERNAALARLAELPDPCDGKEQEAFEAYAVGEKLNMQCHPLHYLFLNGETYAARQGWKAAILYCRKQVDASAGASPVEPNFCESCAMGLSTCDCVTPRPVFVNQLPSAQPSESAEHWHSLYIKKCQELHDEKARLGAEIETLELAAIDDAERYAVPPSQAQPPAPGDTAITYMTGYSDGKEWAQTSQAVVVEPVYQYQLANGNWIDQTKESYDYNVKHGQATVRMLYATPQAAPLYAKEQQ